MSTQRDYREHRYLQGLCAWCNNLRENDTRLCNSCRSKNRTSFKQRRDARVAQGLCSVCGIGDGLLTVGTPLCLNCWFKRIALAITDKQEIACKLRDMFFEQEGRCAYSGEQLIPGVNACIDHKTPRTRGGSNDISNLQWVTKRINLLKGTFTHDEFVSLCVRVANKYHKT